MIIGILTIWFYFIGIIPIIFGFIGIYFSGYEWKNYKKNTAVLDFIAKEKRVRKEKYEKEKEELKLKDDIENLIFDWVVEKKSTNLTLYSDDDGNTFFFHKKDKRRKYGVEMSQVIDEIVKKRNKDDNIEDNVQEAVDLIEDKLLLKLEKKRLKERERQFKIKEMAEKEYYGKIKTKRQLLTERQKEGILSKFNNQCAICGATEGLHIHHKDHNPKNNQIDNLIVLCGVCHKKIHMNVR